MMTVGTVVISAAVAASASAVTIGTTPLNAPTATAEGCELLVLPPLRPQFGVPPSCTFFAPNTQTPPGNHVVTVGRIRTGPRTGPMVFTAVEAMRSKAVPAGGLPAGVICCRASAESQVFTPPPNSIVEVPIRLPMKNTTVLIDREPVEVIDYLGITLLDLNSSAPLGNSSMPATSFLAPGLRTGGEGLRDSVLAPVIPLINGEFTACSGAANAGTAAVSRVPGCPGFRPGGGGTGGGTGAGGGVGAGGGGAGSNVLSVPRNARLLAGGRAARLVARVPRVGVLTVRPAARFRRLVGRTNRRAKRGANPLVVRLTKPGRRALARRGRVRSVVIVRYKPKGGKARTLRRTIVFRRSS